MKTRIALMTALAAALLVTLVCFAQNTDLMTTGGIENGRFWNAMSEDSKVAWLVGYRSGILEAALASSSFSNPSANESTLATEVVKLQNRIMGVSFPSGLTFSEVAKSVDQFYDSPENLRVDLRDALGVVLMKTKGVSQSQIDDQISRIRKSAAEVGQP
jgi:hypothetical protein